MASCHSIIPTFSAKLPPSSTFCKPFQQNFRRPRRFANHFSKTSAVPDVLQTFSAKPLPSPTFWSSGYVTGYNGMVANRLSGGTNYAGAAIVQSFGRYWAASLSTDVSKTFYNNYVYNQATLNGALQFRPNQNFGVTVFGTYSPGTFLTNTPQIGAAWQYGGYITLESDNHWGIDLGASQSYDRFSGHNLTPIVKPYYNLNGAKLGIDFGPMIQGIIMDALGKRGHGSPVEFSPTGPRPMKNLPAVAPRR